MTVNHQQLFICHHRGSSLENRLGDVRLFDESNRKHSTAAHQWRPGFSNQAFKLSLLSLTRITDAPSQSLRRTTLLVSAVAEWKWIYTDVAHWATGLQTRTSDLQPLCQGVKVSQCSWAGDDGVPLLVLGSRAETEASSAPRSASGLLSSVTSAPHSSSFIPLSPCVRELQLEEALEAGGDTKGFNQWDQWKMQTSVLCPMMFDSLLTLGSLWFGA